MKLLTLHSRHTDAGAVLKRYPSTPISAYADSYRTVHAAGAVTLVEPFAVPNTLTIEVNLAQRAIRLHLQNAPELMRRVALQPLPLCVAVMANDESLQFATLLAGESLEHAADLVPFSFLGSAGSTERGAVRSHQMLVTLSKRRVALVECGTAVLRALSASGASLRIYVIGEHNELAMAEALLQTPGADDVLNSSLLLPPLHDLLVQREALNSIFIRLRVRFDSGKNGKGVARVLPYMHSGVTKDSDSDSSENKDLYAASIGWTAHGTAAFCARPELAFVVSLVQRESTTGVTDSRTRAVQLLLFNDGSHSASMLPASATHKSGMRTPRWVPENPLEFPIVGHTGHTGHTDDQNALDTLLPSGYLLDTRAALYSPLSAEVPGAIPAAGSWLRSYAHPDAKAAVQEGYAPAWLMLQFNELSPRASDAEQRMRFSLSGSDPFGRLRAAGITNVYVTLLPEMEGSGGALPPYTLRMTLLYTDNEAGEILSAPCPSNTALEPLQLVTTTQ